MTPFGCLDTDTLAALLESNGTEGARECAAHLDACPDCRRLLADLAADPSTWARVARHLPPSEGIATDAWPCPAPALERVMTELKRELPAPEEAETGQEVQSFLRAPDRPGLLG